MKDSAPEQAMNPPDPVPKPNRKRRWGPPVLPGQIDLRVKQAVEKLQENTKPESTVHEDELSFKRFKGFRRGRSSSTCRQNHPTFESRHKETWRCLVCYLWNNNERYECARCGAQEGVDKEDRTTREGERFALAFSRYRAGPSRDRGPSVSMPRTQEWPPLFETNGSDYVFDSRSEMFYESSSDFFYDPKSRLYYSNRKKAYFRYSESGMPSFQLVSTPAVDANATASTKTSHSPDSTIATKKTIEIKIKSTERSMSRPRGRSVDIKVSDHKKKSQLANIEKWEQQQQIKQKPTPDTKSGMKSRATLSSSLERAREASVSAGRSMSQHSERIGSCRSTLTTAAGLPICALCRRKFPSVEMLRRHEQHSEMHKANLLKASDDVAKRSASVAPERTLPLPATPKEIITPSVVYQDRASKRRQLHGELPAVVPHKVVSIFQEEKARLEQLPPDAALGASNVGHQLFKKMMSKSTPSGASQSVARGSLEETLKKDWEKIEAFARDGGIPQQAQGKLGLSARTTNPFHAQNPY